jgi:cell division protein FtsB
MTSQQQTKKIFNVRTLLYAVAVVLGGVQLFLSCGLSTYGREINQLSSKRTVLERENQRLENQLAQISSLSSIQSRAEKELGMIHPEVEVFPSRRLAQRINADEQ